MDHTIHLTSPKTFAEQRYFQKTRTSSAPLRPPQAEAQRHLFGRLRVRCQYHLSLIHLKAGALDTALPLAEDCLTCVAPRPAEGDAPAHWRRDRTPPPTCLLSSPLALSDKGGHGLIWADL